MQDLTKLTASVDELIASGKSGNTLLEAVNVQINEILGNPTGVSATEVTALRDQICIELDKIGTPTPKKSGKA